MIKSLQSYSNDDKIKLFDKMYANTLTEWNESRTEEDRDEHYYWEAMMETMLGPDIWGR